MEFTTGILNTDNQKSDKFLEHNCYQWISIRPSFASTQKKQLLDSLRLTSNH